MNILRLWSAMAAISFCFASSFAAPQGSARLLVHLLDYVGMDYPGAVSEGKVLSATEYQEQVEFVATASEMAAALPEIKTDEEIRSHLEDLKALIKAKGSAETVARLSLQIKKRVILLGKVQIAPQQWPDHKRGRELFAANCTSCHGTAGGGDGPAGKHLDPAPANFLDLQKGADISPFRAFNAIRVGIPGTGMAAFPFNDEETWNMAFFVTSLHHQAQISSGLPLPQAQDVSAEKLVLVASKSDNELRQELLEIGDENERNMAILAWRMHSGNGPSDGTGGGGHSSLKVARDYLSSSLKSYRAGDKDEAKQQALLAYLEGIEPAEPKLKANDAGFTVSLEEKMAAVRSRIEALAPVPEVEGAIQSAQSAITQAEAILAAQGASDWLIFVMTSGILLREGFEAVLILIALLAVVRASSSRKAERYIHMGWIGALLTGVLAWFFSGWLLGMSGANREMLEAVTSLFAVAVLLYIGFWLHSRTEIHRWKAFIEGRVQTLLQGKRLLGLAAISFVAVFREAFETVLFLRAIALEGGGDQTRPMVIGVVLSLGGIFVMSWALLKYSAKLPIRKLFAISSGLMALLALILTGKGVHALQETGALSVTQIPVSIRSDLLGFFPTRETLVPQLAVGLVLCVLWLIGRKPPASVISQAPIA